jgi:hypothetical protein
VRNCSSFSLFTFYLASCQASPKRMATDPTQWPHENEYNTIDTPSPCAYHQRITCFVVHRDLHDKTRCSCPVSLVPFERRSIPRCHSPVDPTSMRVGHTIQHLHGEVTHDIAIERLSSGAAEARAINILINPVESSRAHITPYNFLGGGFGVIVRSCAP